MLECVDHTTTTRERFHTGNPRALMHHYTSRFVSFLFITTFTAVARFCPTSIRRKQRMLSQGHKTDASELDKDEIFNNGT